MTVRTSRLLVIDASVMRSAGETEHPVSSACREALLVILRICHRVVTTDTIHDEWKSHMSRFARKWLCSMAAHRKPSERVNPADVSVDMAEWSDLDQRVVAKDLRLIEAAFSSDRIIVTRDDVFQRTLAKTRKGAHLLKSITWVNPVSDGIAQLETL